MVIRTGDGQLTRIAVESLQKISFDDTAMQVHLVTGDVTAIPFGALRFFSFESITGVLPAVANANWIVVPTHVDDHFTIKNLAEGQHHVIIFSYAGQIVYEQRIDQWQDGVHVEQLPAGAYLVRIGNRTMKFIKN